jgi:hypothetical protein
MAAERSSIHLPLALRAGLAPAIAWVAMTISAFGAGQPGVVCLTPLAWSLAIYSGTFYGRRIGAGRPAFPGGLLAGALLGLAQGALFAFGNARMMAVETSAEGVARGNQIAFMVVLAGIVICALLSGLLAHTTQRRLGAQDRHG